MRLPSSHEELSSPLLMLVQQQTASPAGKISARARLRVPMKPHLLAPQMKERAQHVEKMGQVQDDQSRTSDEENSFIASSTSSAATIMITTSSSTADDDNHDGGIVKPNQEMGVKHATSLKLLEPQQRRAPEKESTLMNSTSSSLPSGTTMPTVLNRNHNRKNNSQIYEDDYDEGVKSRNTKIMSGGDPPTDKSRHECAPEIREKGAPSSANSQINCSAFFKVNRRTLWRGGKGLCSLRNNYHFPTLCLLFWILGTGCSWVGTVQAITSLESGGLISTGNAGHKLSERSAGAIVKLERDYHPTFFPKKESQLEDNHLHSQQSFNDQPHTDKSFFDESGNLITAEAFVGQDDDRNHEEYPADPTHLPEPSKSTIIFRGIRNRTRVEVAPVSLFATKRKSFSENSDEQLSNRRGRVMFPKSEQLKEREGNGSVPGNSRTTKSEALLSQTLGQSSEEGSSRKASPDVQDIIDGIVKLLGGKVHHPQPASSPAAAVAPVPFSHRQPQSTAYNLFNPTKPIFYQTVKPSRINSRGPPLGGTHQQQQQQQQQSQQQSSFEAIPLEALNADFKLNLTKFGPPFPLSQVVPPEAPYKQGVPVPEQLVPPTNGNFNLRQPPLPPSTATSSYVTTVNDERQLGSHPHDNRPNNGFFTHNGSNRYNNGNVPQQHHHWPSSAAPSSSSSLPSSLPTASNHHNGNTGLTTVPAGLTTTPIRNTHHHQSEDNFNENGTRNPYATNLSHLNLNHNDEDTRRPATSSIDEGSDTGSTALTTIPANGQDKYLVENNRALSSPRPPPLSLTLPTGPEDDEEDDLRFTTNVDFDLGGGQNGIKWNEGPTPDLLANKRPDQPIGLEPTITEDSQLPSWTTTDGRIGGGKETVFEFSELGSNSQQPTPATNNNGFIRPTSANSLYPTLVLETNSENGLVEIVTKLAAPSGVGTVDFTQPQIIPVPTKHKLSTDTAFNSAQTPHPDSNLRKQVQQFNSLLSTTRQTPTSSSVDSSQSIHVLPTPPLRPGIVINDGPAANDGKGYGSVEVVTVDESANNGKVGEIFDVTVTAKQSFGGRATVTPFGGVSDAKDELVITQPTGTEQYVSIDGKRTYFNLHPNTPTAVGAGGATKAVGHVMPVENTDVINVEVAKPGKPTTTATSGKPAGSQNIGVGSVGNPVPLLPQPPGKTLFGVGGGSGSAPSRAISTSLSISGGSSGMTMTGPSGASGSKTLPNLIRRPHTRRPSIPPVRIDTCIVGDDTTCNVDQGEVCRTESGVSSCVCRSGYARRRHREPCKAIVSLVMSIKLDKLGDKKLTYNPDYFNPNSELYQTLEWETIHAMDSAMGETTLSTGYVGSKLEAIGFDGRHAVVNTTILLQENPKQAPSQVKRDLQKQMIQVLTRNRNNFGKSQLWVEGPISAVAAITDFDECESLETNDCDIKAKCVNTLGSFECRCESGYGDQFEKDKRRSGRRCESCSGKAYCNGRGDCLIENGQKICKCAGNYYGSQCDIDGEVLAVAIGASVSAVVIIGLTLACLCMWSRKWKREEQKAALMSRTLFGGMATQALSYLGKNNSNPYQQHLSMDDRLRWAQEASMGGNIYVQNEPMSMHTSPQLMGPSMMETPPLMSARRSAETVDTTVDELFDDRQTKRPRSRASQMQGSLYYDLEPEPKSDIYASRSMVQFPAQFCVPMGPMSHYAPPSRGYFP